MKPRLALALVVVALVLLGSVKLFWLEPRTLKAMTPVMTAPAYTFAKVAAPPPKLDPNCPTVERIALIGDSYGEGIGPHLKPFMERCGVDYTLDARRGTSATQWVRDDWIGPVLRVKKPQVVLVSLGGNDFQHGNKPVLQEAVDSLIAQIHAAGARLLWIEPLRLPYRDLVGARAMWKTAVGGDFFPGEELIFKRTPDGVHTSYSNYRRWAKLIWPWLVDKTHESQL